MKTLVTGATGFLGSHIAERLLSRGDSVRALVRPTSDTSFLESLGVELVCGDVTDAPTLSPTLGGIDVVFHAAALVSDWGPWEGFRTVTINGTRNMLKAAVAASTPRFLYVSTDGVYRYQDLRKGVNEESPTETRFGPLDYYRKSKTAAEKIARRFQRDGHAVSIVRPALSLGERDVAMLPGVVAFLKGPLSFYIGNGRNPLPYIYAGDVADLCIRAATSDLAQGQIYNAVSDEPVTQRDLFQTAAEIVNVRQPQRHMPFRLVYAITAAIEMKSRIGGWDSRPDLTRFSANQLGIEWREDASKATRDLGWKPEVSLREAVTRSVGWHRFPNRSCR
ncbi:MAG: NAD-dependent epimerase/dehydratase family protein [Chloroflexota bacterium]|nr:NAD-dependent epimerase/dehydratase family protein [Chloroflexota bacterium]